MSRVQLAINVEALDPAIEFYSKLFATDPAKVRPGYANFAIAEPPLKLVLIETPGQGGTLNHLGVEVASTDEVVAAQARLSGQGLTTASEEGVACCYARQDKVWVDGPSGEPWEIYTVLEDVEMLGGQLRVVDPETGATCCFGLDDGAPCPTPPPTAADPARGERSGPPARNRHRPWRVDFLRADDAEVDQRRREAQALRRSRPR